MAKDKDDLKKQKIIKKGYKKRPKSVIFYQEWDLRDVADLLITDPKDIP